MDAGRTKAYGRVMATLADLSGSTLHADEQDTVRAAADALLFCERLPEDEDAEQALSDVYALTDRLVETERMAPEKTRQLATDIEDCGPARAASR